MKADRVTNADMILKTHNEFSDVFTRIGCFNDTYSVQVKYDAKPYQEPPRHVAY